MKQEHKLMAAVALLAVLGVGVYVSRSGADKRAAEHSMKGAQDLPVVKVSKEDAEKITKLIIENKDKGEVTLEKKDERWVLTKPLKAPASQSNLKSLIENIQKIELSASIAPGTDAYAKYELEGDKAVHAQAFAGDKKLLDMFFGKSGGRGQMARVAGKDGVYAAKGYSSYLWAREVKNWRETEILKFDDAKAVSVEVVNEHGKLSFAKKDGKWAAKRFERKGGKLSATASKWERFDEAKIKDMLRAYKNLRATNFADKDADSGVDDAVSAGGLVHIKLEGGDGDYQLEVGNKQEGSNRYLRKKGGDGTVYVVTSWAADWATAEPKKFEKPEDKKPGDKDDAKAGKGKKAAKPATPAKGAPPKPATPAKGAAPKPAKK